MQVVDDVEVRVSVRIEKFGRGAELVLLFFGGCARCEGVLAFLGACVAASRGLPLPQVLPRDCWTAGGARGKKLEGV